MSKSKVEVKKNEYGRIAEIILHSPKAERAFKRIVRELRGKSRKADINLPLKKFCRQVDRDTVVEDFFPNSYIEYWGRRRAEYVTTSGRRISLNGRDLKCSFGAGGSEYLATEILRILEEMGEKVFFFSTI